MEIHGYDRSVYLAYLQAVPMFRDCTSDDLERVTDLASPLAVEPGEELVREGEAGDEFFVLCTGRASVTRGGREVASLGQGDFFGEIALFTDEPRNATVCAATPSTLVVLSRPTFESLLGDVPPIRDRILRGMARRLHELDGKC